MGWLSTCGGVSRRERFDSSPVHMKKGELTKYRRKPNDIRDVGFLYLLENGGYHKIGITSNLRKRVSVLQSGSPHEIVVVAANEVEDRLLWEKRLHEIFIEYHHRGEWYVLPDNIVKEVTEFIDNPKEASWKY